MPSDEGFDPGAGTSADAPSFSEDTIFGINPKEANAPVRVKGRPSGLSASDRRLMGVEDPAILQPQYRTYGELLQGFYSLQDQELIDVQMALYRGGFYTSSYYSKTGGKLPHFGAHDDDSYAAYKKLVRQGAANPHRSIDEILAEAAGGMDASGLGGEGAGATRVPLTTQLTSPTDLLAVARRVAPTELGRELSAAEADAFVKSFQSIQAGAQSAAYNTAPTGGTVTAEPSPTAAAEEQIRRQRPGESGAYSILNAYDAVLSMFGASTPKLGG